MVGGGGRAYPPDSSSKNTSLPDQPEIASYGPGSVPDLKPRLSAHVSPVVDTDELATTFLDEHQLAKQGLCVEHKEGPDYRKPVCVSVCSDQKSVIKVNFPTLSYLSTGYYYVCMYVSKAHSPKYMIVFNCNHTCTAIQNQNQQKSGYVIAKCFNMRQVLV